MKRAPTIERRTGTNVPSVPVTPVGRGAIQTWARTRNGARPEPPPEQAPAPAPQRQGGRIRSLDGLRGLAALVVVMNHALIAAVGPFADTYAGRPPPKAGTALWWLGYTPLRIFWSGPEAVVLFFVLSGFVLALPAVRRGGRWFDVSYYPRRVLRLYLPVWAALVVAVVLHAAVARTPVAGASWWLNWHAIPMTLRDWLSSAGLLHERNGFEFSSALSSLKWEVIFSLVLPLGVLFPLLTRRRPLIAGAGVAGGLVVVFLGTARGNLYAEMLPMFVIGSVLAFQADRIRALLARQPPKPIGWVLVAAIALIAVSLMTAPYLLLLPQVRPVRLSAYDLYALSLVAVTVGASVLLCLGLLMPTWRRVLESRLVQWCGSRSYSLYLVHEPVVVTTAFLLGGRPAVLPYLLLAIGASLVLAELFWRAVEHPGLAAARWTGAAVRTGLRRLVVRDRPAAAPPVVPLAPAGPSPARPAPDGEAEPNLPLAPLTVEEPWVGPGADEPVVVDTRMRFRSSFNGAATH